MSNKKPENGPKISIGDSLAEQGAITRRKILGDSYIQSTEKSASELDRELREISLINIWGRTWSRGILSHQELSIINLALMAAMNRMTEFERHCRTALLNTKVPPEKIRELIVHLSVYCGMPVALEAVRVLRRVLQQEGISEDVFGASSLPDSATPTEISR
jgi:4-carboxymuconolactone decarboxylase